MEKHQIDYLRLFVMTMKSLRNRKAEELEPGIFLLDNHAGDYIVSLYAGIWRKDFMEKTLTKTLNAWQYEVALTNMARQLNARCADSRRGEFPILDVIRKGKVLTKARKYFVGILFIKVTERICELKMNGCLNSGRGFVSGFRSRCSISQRQS